MTDKGPDAFRTISEVAEDLDVPQHVLRFWETRFSQIRPMKRGGGRRYYRPDDVDLLRGIRKLLYGDGYTIKGVQRILKERGVRHVIAIGQGRDPDQEETGAASAAAPATGQGEATPVQPAVTAPATIPNAPQRVVTQAAAPAEPVTPAVAPAPEPSQAPVQPSPAVSSAPSAQMQPATTSAPPPPAAPATVSEVPPAAPAAQSPHQPSPVQPAPADPRPAPARPFAGPLPAAQPGETESSALPRLDSLRMFAHDRLGGGPGGVQAPAMESGNAPASAAGQFAERPGNGHERAPLPGRPPVAVPAVGAVGQSLSTDDIRRLQAVLYELSECRQLLTEALKR